tara:strand:- start:6363 stop:7679 length:1317 start_codon:yes stop_codon:yes gene_type:complete
VRDDDKLLIRAEGLCINRGSQRVINDLNLELLQGEIIILSGENGCGKSTLIEAFANLINPEKGTIIHTSPRFGLTLQQNGINGDELVNERISYSMMVANGDPENMDNLLEHWNIQHRKSDQIAHLSFGIKRRVSVIQGLMPAYCSNLPTFCLLDEPTEGLDRNSVKLLANDLVSLSKKGHGFIIATHDSRIKDIATKICEMGKNKIDFKIIENQKLDEGVLPQINQKDGDINYAKSIWSKNISKRTKLPLLNRGFPLFVSLLIITALITGLKTDLIPSHIAGAMILLPSFLAALTKPAELKYFKEERCGDWWKAMINGPILSKITLTEILMILLVPFISSYLILNDFPNNDGFVILILCSITMVLVMYANNAIYSLAENLPRKNATYIPLLTLILIWPYIISSDILLNSVLNEVINEIIIIIIIPCIIFLILPTLSKK